jgi:hypothetical protein
MHIKSKHDLLAKIVIPDCQYTTYLLKTSFAMVASCMLDVPS